MQGVAIAHGDYRFGNCLVDIERALIDGHPGLVLHGPRGARLPNTASVSFRGLEANTILSELAGVAASAGAPQSWSAKVTRRQAAGSAAARPSIRP